MGPLACQVDTMTWRQVCFALWAWSDWTLARRLLPSFSSPQPKEKESEQTRMHTLNFVVDLSFQQGNLPVSIPQNSTNRVISAVALTVQNTALLNCCGIVRCISEVISVQIALKLVSANYELLFQCHLGLACQWIRGIEEEITKISLISLGVKDRRGLMSSIGCVGCLRLLNLKKQVSRVSIYQRKP